MNFYCDDFVTGQQTIINDSTYHDSTDVMLQVKIL